MTARLCTALVVVACACRQNNHAHSNEQVPEPLAETTRVVAEPEAPTGYIGVLTPKAQAAIIAPFATTVKRYLVGVGEVVNKDAPLAVLDDQPLLQQLQTTTADLRTAKTQLAQAYANVANQKKMLRAGTVALATVQDAEYAAATAGTKVERAKADAEAVKLKLSKTTLVAPIAGKVSDEYIKAGDQVKESEAVVRLISSDELFVRFAIPTDQADKVTLEAPLEIVIDARGQRVVAKGTVTSIAPELDPIARMIVAEAELVDPPKGLQSGLVCRIKVAQPAGAPPPTGAPAPPPTTPPAQPR